MFWLLCRVNLWFSALPRECISYTSSTVLSFSPNGVFIVRFPLFPVLSVVSYLNMIGIWLEPNGDGAKSNHLSIFHLRPAERANTLSPQKVSPGQAGRWADIPQYHGWGIAYWRSNQWHKDLLKSPALNVIHTIALNKVVDVEGVQPWTSYS